MLGEAGSARACDDEFGGSLAGHGIEQLVLHFGEEELRGAVVGAVVGAQREEVTHLLIEALLRCAYLADARQQLIEVIPAVGVLQALVVHHEAPGEVLAQVRGGPLAELGAARRANAVAYGQDHRQAVEQGRAAHAP